MALQRIIVLLFVLIALNSCKQKVTNGEKPAPAAEGKPGAGKPPGGPLRVDIYVVRSSTLHESIDVAGSLLPFDETDIHPEVSGRITMLHIQEGAYVSKGTVLAKLFDGDLQAQLHKLQIQLQLAQKTENRQSQLLKIGGISQADYDLSVLSAGSIRADIQVMQANLSKTVIRAPFNGKIAFKNVSVGAYITPATNVTTIRAVDRLKLEFSVPEKYESKVGVGEHISFTIEGISNRYNARVIARESTISQENRSLKVRALVEQVDKYLSAGGFAKVTFNMGDNDKALLIPSQALIPGARDKKVVLARNGSAVFQVVKTGTRDSANIQITEGLAIGDSVVTSGLLTLKPGSKIQLSGPKKQMQ